MRELILLRHAHAEPAMAGEADLDRPLSPEGLVEAEKAGKWLAEKKLTPDYVLCSPARRARETLDAVLAIVGKIGRDLDTRIYEAKPGDLMGVVEDHRDKDRVMVVGHNPGLEQLMALLSTGQTTEYRGMPTASVVVLSLSADAPIEPEVARLAAFWWP